MQYRTNSMAEGTFYTYLFEKNLQGDIIAVYNTSGTKLVSYVYDAWGNVTVTNHNVSGTNSGARHNPFRYRGYYYDTETGYYYLQSRYYNPKWGRFINADSCLYNSLIGFNLFAYCENNPVNYYDPHGDDAVTLFWGWLSGGWAPALAEPTPGGEIIYGAGIIVLGFAAAVEIIFVADATVDLIQDATDTTPDSNTNPDNNKTDGLPNQGVVSEDPDAPPVDAGKQGKHVIGHKNNTNPDKSTWRPGENGVRETQEAWKNGKDVPGRNGTVRIGTSSDGRTIKVHRDSRGNIHGYPIFPK